MKGLGATSATEPENSRALERFRTVFALHKGSTSPEERELQLSSQLRKPEDLKMTDAINALMAQLTQGKPVQGSGRQTVGSEAGGSSFETARTKSVSASA